MRLFVAAWLPDEVIETVAEVIKGRAAPGPRWIDRSKWHVTLEFLGEVPDGDVSDLIDAVARAGAVALPRVAQLGPATTTLGRAVLCVPVQGLEDLAREVRRATTFFNHPTDGDRPFAGHLTLARAPRRGAIPQALRGIAVSARWAVEDIAVVLSTTGPDGASYTTLATVRLEG